MSNAQTTRPRPLRPSRSVERLTIQTTDTPSTPPPLPLGDHTSSPDSPSIQTPTTPTQSYHRGGNRKSITNIRRKPVPLTPDDFELELSNLHSNPDGHPSTPITPTPSSSQAPPTYPYAHSIPSYSHSHVLLVDPPTYHADGDDPFRTPQASATASRATLPDFDMGVHGSRPSGEDLPTYAIETQTEPETLARGLWRIGFVIPILWIIGMCILWIPLKPVEEETDPEKAQKMSEMITILRKTELKYARRCKWGVIGWALAIIAIIVICVVVQHT